jgi:hypothetical protein
MAGLAGSIAGWVVEDLTRPYLGIAGSAAVSLLVFVAAYVKVRKWLRDLRDS